MAFLTEEQLKKMGFKSLGKNIKISDKASIYGCENISIGNDVRIDDFCAFSGKITIGNNVHIATLSHLAGGAQGITIEDFAGIAFGVHIFTETDDYSGEYLTNPTVPLKYRKRIEKEVIIKRHAIVGAKSLILPGVILEEGTAIGAMSLVNKSTKPWLIYMGMPARAIKRRNNELLKYEEQYFNEKNTIK